MRGEERRGEERSGEEKREEEKRRREEKRGGVPNRTKDRPRHPVVSLTHRPEVRTNELIVRAPPVDGITALTGPQSPDLATEFRFNKLLLTYDSVEEEEEEEEDEDEEEEEEEEKEEEEEILRPP
ncbi:hypothetical protein HZH66_003518 [Vespula vulgaris]|uniref:Uncharacterized protein n=1 Tax=Vespula vulgaris TaxID=7454 RepID=A0A834NCX5_VESVU|nr:hypothetical protein HZH66_003518 [Vespula vulgaris]